MKNSKQTISQEQEQNISHQTINTIKINMSKIDLQQRNQNIDQIEVIQAKTPKIEQKQYLQRIQLENNSESNLICRSELQDYKNNNNNQGDHDDEVQLQNIQKNTNKNDFSKQNSDEIINQQKQTIQLDSNKSKNNEQGNQIQEQNIQIVEIPKNNENSQKKEKEKKQCVNMKGILGILIDEMNPIIVVILSFFAFFTNLIVFGQIANQDSINRPDLLCQNINYNNIELQNTIQCEQQISIHTFYNCLNDYYKDHLFYQINASQYKFECSSEGIVDVNDLRREDLQEDLDPNEIETVYFQRSAKRKKAFDDSNLSQQIHVVCQAGFLTIIIIAITIYVQSKSKYGTGGYVLFSLKLEFNNFFRISIYFSTIAFLVIISGALVYTQVQYHSDGLFMPIISFSFLLVIQFRYMLLKRRQWLDLEHPCFNDAVFKRKGITEFICSNNFIYFNALERAAVEDLQTENPQDHVNLKQMVEKGDCQKISNILLNRPIEYNGSEDDYFKVYQQTEEEKKNLSNSIDWKSILFIITNEFRELLNILFQLIGTTVSLSVESKIIGNKKNLGCGIYSSNPNSCKSQINVGDYVSCISQYFNGFYMFGHNLFTDTDYFCLPGGNILNSKSDIPKGYIKDELYILEIGLEFALIRILLYCVVFGILLLIIFIYYQYFSQKPGKYNTGQFLVFCLNVDQGMKFKFYSKIVLSVYVICNSAILIIIMERNNGSSVLANIFTTFSVFSEFRALIWNQKISQNIQHPAFQQAEFCRGGVSWFIWIYSDKYFNYLELAAQADLKLQKQQQQQQEEKQNQEQQKQQKNRKKSIFSRTNTVSNNLKEDIEKKVRKVRTIDKISIQNMSDQMKEQYKRFPNLSQYVVKGDIEKICKILNYDI